MVCFRRFLVEEPRHSETISNEKCHLYRSTRLQSSLYSAVGEVALFGLTNVSDLLIG